MGIEVNKVVGDATNAPLYRQVYKDLRTRILSGTYESGDTLPSEDALSKEYGVSKITTRRALQELALDGLVLRRQGIGTLVRAQTSQFIFDGDVGSLLENFAFQSKDQTYKILKFEREALADDVCDQLDVAPNTRGLHVLSVAVRDGERAYYTSTSIVEPACRGLTKESLRRSAAVLVLMQEGMTIGAADQKLMAVSPPAHVQKALGIGDTHPTLRARLTIFDQDGDGVEHVDSYLRGDLFEYRSLMTRRGSAIAGR